MLTRLHLRNFKSWTDTGDVVLRPITGFFGANSSGKSSLLHAILLLKQTSDSRDRGLVFHFGDKSTPVDLGDFASVLHGHKLGRELEMSLDWRGGSPMVIKDTKSNGRTVASSSTLGFSVVTEKAAAMGPSRPVVREMNYRVGEARFGMRRSLSRKGAYELRSDTPDHADFGFVRSVGRPGILPGPEKCYGFPDLVRAYYQNAGFLADLALALEQRLDKVAYLGPLRAHPERRYAWTGARPADMGRAGEAIVDAILAARERGDLISPGYKMRRLSVEQYVARWLKALGLIHDFRVVSVGEDSQMYEVRVRRTPRSADVLVTDVGFGVSQILPVLVLCLFVPEGSTVLLEQPEIHLHPSVQSGLADIMIDAWKNRKVQVIVESHSEHLLRRLQRRIAEAEVTSDDVGLYFCDLGSSRSELSRLDLDMFGNIRNWPPGFFGDEFEEIAAMTRAAEQRKAQGQ